MSDFLTRLIDERNQLEGKFNKLSEFIGSSKFDQVAHQQKNLLTIQHSAMHTYLLCLQQRIADLQFDSNPPSGPGTPP